MIRRLTAMVIGNAAYEGTSNLKNSSNDGNDLAAKLEARGFEVVKLIDCSNAGAGTRLRSASSSSRSTWR